MLLLVDDDPKFLEVAEKLLGHGGDVFLAGSAEHAKVLMSTVGGDFTLVLIDLDLPGQDGFSLIREMRLHFPDLPVIAISGVCRENVLESAKLLGAADALKKPITPEWKVAIRRVQAKAAGE
jgi:two-component system response regulator FlrC